MLRFQIISHHFKKLKKKPNSSKDIIVNDDFRNIKTIEFFIEKYSQIKVYMTRHSIPSCGAAGRPQLWESC